MKEKLASRKFWFGVAGVVLGVALVVVGVRPSNAEIGQGGVGLIAVAVGGYPLAEAIADAARAVANKVITQIGASTTDKAIVAKALDGEAEKAGVS